MEGSREMLGWQQMGFLLARMKTGWASCRQEGRTRVLKANITL